MLVGITLPLDKESWCPSALQSDGYVLSSISPLHLVMGYQVPFQPLQSQVSSGRATAVLNQVHMECESRTAAPAVETAKILTMKRGWHQGRESCCSCAGNDWPVSPPAQLCSDPDARSTAKTYSLQASYTASQPIHLLPAPGPALCWVGPRASMPYNTSLWLQHRTFVFNFKEMTSPTTNVASMIAPLVESEPDIDLSPQLPQHLLVLFKMSSLN